MCRTSGTQGDDSSKSKNSMMSPENKGSLSPEVLQK